MLQETSSFLNCSHLHTWSWKASLIPMWLDLNWCKQFDAKPKTIGKEKLPDLFLSFAKSELEFRFHCCGFHPLIPQVNLHSAFSFLKFYSR